ncbi:CASP-like protein 1E1 isoform X1 [Benincasa hispida]|uniref:CASP-like protein 1E1 isoform X1 n=1 Tax=Benincasa hispida TaxID=102211 RepID=UPI001901355A|nr:CASP-like protein 1E1 isoform X1 [Benincasa hispida]
MSCGGKLEVIFRVLGILLSSVAAIVVGVGKETKVVPITISSKLPPFQIVVVAKWYYLSAFVYLFVTNVITSSYGLLSLLLRLSNKNLSNNKLTVLIIFLDTVTVALLSSGTGAVMAIGVMGYNGNSHVRWNKVCDTFGRFCKQVAASAVLSLAGAIVFMLLVILAVLGLLKRPK